MSLNHWQTSDFYIAEGRRVGPPKILLLKSQSQKTGIMPHATMAPPSLNTLHRADGSATCSSNGYSVVAAVNGPIDVQRRDELPEEAAIDVAIRPASGVGGQ